MEDGRIVEQGNHDELIAADGAYAALYHAQFTGPRVSTPPAHAPIAAAGPAMPTPVSD
jgi:ATP-binding cassette subfamily B protein